MADLTYKVAVDTVSANQNLKNLESQIVKTSSGFSALRTSIVAAGAAAGVAFVGFAVSVRATMNSVDALAKSARALGTSFDSFQALTRSAGLAGVSAEALNSTLQRLQVNIGQGLARGTGPAVEAMARLGLNMREVSQLPLEQQLTSITAALRDVENPATRAALATELLGRQGPRMLEVADNMVRLREEASRMGLALSAVDTAAIETANDSFSELQIVLENVRQAIAAEVAPLLIAISRYIKDAITESGNFGNVIRQGVVPAIRLAAQTFAAFVAIIVAGKIVAIVSAIVGAFISLVTAIRTASIAMAAFNSVAGRNPLIKIASALLSIGAAVFAIDAVSDAFDSLDGEIAKILEELDKANAEIENMAVPDLEINVDTSGIDSAVDSFNDLRLQILNASTAFGEFTRQKIQDIELSTRLIGASREQIELERARIDIARRAQAEIQRLEQQRARLSPAQQAAGLETDIDQQIAAVRRIQEEDTARTEAAISNSQRRQESERLETFEKTQLLDVQKQIRQVQDQIASSTMTAMERLSFQIRRNAEETALAEIRAEEARRGSKLNQSEVEAFYRAAAQGAEQLIQVQERHLRQSRSWSDGWRKAYNEYSDNATNAAKLAETVFRKSVQGIEDILVGFVKTGKFEWRSFVADITETLLRSQIQQLISKTFAPDGILGGLSSMLGLGNLFGGGGGGGTRGQSASTPLFVQNVGGMAGSAAGGAGGGSDILSQLGNIFGGSSGTSARTPGINPAANNTNVMGQNISSIGASIGKVASGLGTALASVGKSLFGGFFATGGMIPPGRFGVVGERGAEFVQGPATVTPMGNTSVTYNIQAVDAASFKALISRDPGFIHAVAMQGAGSMPFRR